MRMQITVDEKTKEAVERLARIVGVSQSCIFSYGIYCVCHEINTNEDKIFEELFNYSESFYKYYNKQGGRNEKKKKTFEKKSKNLSDSRRISTVKSNCKGGMCEECKIPYECPYGGTPGDWVVGEM